MDARTRGRVLVAVGLLGLAITIGASAATAPSLDVAGDGDRQTLVGSQGGGPGWHEYGSVYLLDGSDVAWRAFHTDSYFDVTRMDDGRVLAGFMDSGYEEGCEPYETRCTKTGFRILDPDGAGGADVVEEYAFPVRSQSNSEVHEVERLSDGGYLLADMDRERLFAVRDGEVTWQWNASSFYEPPEDPTRRDWLHLNDVDAVNDTHYLLSVRNANQILLIERGSGVVEVINEDDGGPDDSCLRSGQLVDDDGDGDVRCGDPEVLDHQHNPQWLDEGAVLVADSENDRVVELHRNETTGEWEPAWSLTHAGGIDLNWPRDADRLDNGTTLITDTLNKRVLEVTENGGVVWSTRTERIPYEADRLPESERVGADRYDPQGQVSNPAGDVPGLSIGLVVLRAVFPWTPFWFRELQLAGTLGSLVLIGVGVVLSRRG